MVDRSNVIKWSLFAAIIFLIGFVFFKFFRIIQNWFGDSDEITKQTKKEDAEDAKKIPDALPLPIEKGGEIGINFNPIPYSDELYISLNETHWTGWTAGDRCAACKRANDLSDNELRAVYNDYKNRKKQSLRKALINVFWDGCFTGNAVNKLKARLDNMELI